MNTGEISDAREWFQVLQTSEKSQVAVMRLEPGGASGPVANSHERSEQVLLVLAGEVEAEMAGEKRTLRKGEFVLVPAGVKHRFINLTDMPATTFNVYSPPEYPASARG